jgi:glycosyltransferase involved in cell wall biosynthesis
MLRQLSSRKNYIPALKSQIYSSFSMNILDLDEQDFFDSKPRINSFVNKFSYKKKCSRILLISHEDSHTGAPIYLKQLAGQLESHGFHVHIISLRPELRNGNFSDLKKRHTYLKDYLERKDRQSDILRNWLLTKAGEKAFKKALKTIKPDLVLANTLNSSDTIRVLQNLDIPSILYVHESWNFDGPNWTTRDIFALRVKDALEASNLTIFGSTATQTHWHSSGFAINSLAIPSYRKISRHKSRIIENSRSKSRAKLGISTNIKVFLSVATFEPRKRIQDIVTAFNSLSDLNTHLILVGANHFSPNVEITNLILDHSRVTVVKSTEDLLNYYAAADCFVFASDQETMPLVLQEAALYKIPRIVSKYSGYRELIPSEEFAFLFPPRDIPELTQQMNKFLCSPEVALEMATRAHALQNSFLERGDSALMLAIKSVLEIRTSVFPSEWADEKN